jgi:ABC-type transport system involved in multi-copper enzyme maturation permease subunit
MKALIQKEIRLLLPVFAAALLLSILPVWLLPPDPGNGGGISSGLYLLGTLMLALASFGRESGLKTFPFILAQPLERSRIWRTKIVVLGVCLVLVYVVWIVSSVLDAVFVPNPVFVSKRLVEPEALFVFGLIAVVFTAGALWLTLLLRQMAAAFWLTLLIPNVFVMIIVALGGTNWMICTGVGAYAVAAFFLARWQFFHLQDTAWTGGTLTLGRGSNVAAEATPRSRGVWGALIRKELKLHEITLAGMAALFVVHLLVIAVRNAGANVFGTMTRAALEAFGAVWVFVPLVAGSQSVAEERQLGTLDGALCLPVSRRAQFTIKIGFVVVIGGLLSAALLWLAEWIGSAFGGGTVLGMMRNPDEFIDFVVILFLAVSLAGFYASTLTRTVSQALAAGVVAAGLLIWIAFGFGNPPVTVAAFGRRLWPAMARPALAATIILLSYGNFKWLFESRRRWRRNVIGLATVIVLVAGSAAAVYHRVWELAMPLEEAHGAARLARGKPVTFRNFGSSELAALLPDGRLWVDRAVEGSAYTSGGYFAPGSNWVDVALLSDESVAIRSDGTLWVSEKPGWQDHLVQFGTENAWKSVEEYSYYSVVLLKRDGTLWHWGPSAFERVRSISGDRGWGLGTNSYPGVYPGLRAFFTPQRLNSDSDWARMTHGGGMRLYAWKQDGAAWAFRSETNGDWSKVRVTDLDHIQFKSFTWGPELGVLNDGTLWKHWFWMAQKTPRSPGSKPASSDFVQIGKDSDWAEIAQGRQLVGLKTDGSIWRWRAYRDGDPLNVMLQDPPERMGTHSDWVGVSIWMREPVALAADGTLWRWRPPDQPPESQWDLDSWLAPSRKPVRIENILDAWNDSIQREFARSAALPRN